MWTSKSNKSNRSSTASFPELVLHSLTTEPPTDRRQTGSSFLSADLVDTLVSKKTQTTIAPTGSMKIPLKDLDAILEGRFSSIDAQLSHKRSIDDTETNCFDPHEIFTNEDSPDLSWLLGDVEPVYFSTYTNKDVLAERGHRSNNHPGNEMYRAEKERLQPRYLATSSKTEKTMIAMELVDTVHQWGGRFLRMDKKKGLYYELDEKAARRKASQALRENLTPEDREQKRRKYGKTKEGMLTDLSVFNIDLDDSVFA